jgi:xanthine dehydrogenase molybdenum-binding subunit
MPIDININVNGDDLILGVEPGESLADLLRERLDLTGTKIGCNEAECGSCSVILDGEAVLSCTYPAIRAHGSTILTIEGLSGYESRKFGLSGNENQLHPLQEAFITHGAVQCGFCIPGQIITAHALLERKPEPTSEDIRKALKDTLCRCASYPAIERAILAAAKTLNTGEPISTAVSSLSGKPLTNIGINQARPDAIEKVTGDAIFTDDLKFNGMLYARVKRAEIPHGILVNLNTDTAKSLSGVEAVLTAENIPGNHNHGIVIQDWPTIVGIGERVRYVGDTIAIVAAKTSDIAAKAIELIEAEFETIDVVDNPVQARDSEAPLLHEKGNLLKHIKVRKGDISEGFLEADTIIERTYFTQTTEHAFLEPECSIAVPLDDGRMEIYVGSQIPYADRNQIAGALGWPEERIRVIGQLMGGGFGGKEDIAGQIHAALLADFTGRPVKLLFDRQESLLVHPKRHATQIKVKLGAKKDGRLTAVKTELYGDTGAYASLGEKVMARATTHSSGPYGIPNVHADCYAMYTNNPPAGAFRGFGALQGQFAIESMMDELAETLDMNPVDLRKINALRVGSMTNTGQVLRESVGLLECVEKVQSEMEKIAKQEGYSTPFEPYIDINRNHLSRSWGFAVAYKNTGLGGGAPDKARAEVELYPDGSLQIRTSSAELGQGLVTVLRMIVAEEFSVLPQKVDVLVMDTDLTPDGGPTTASRQTYVTGNAAQYASKSLKQAITATLAEKYDQPPEDIHFIEGLVEVGETQVRLGQVVESLRSENREPIANYEYWAPATKPLGEGGDMHFAFSFAAQAAEVEVNTHTGEIKVLRVIAANDVGKVLNPLGLQGQVEGGVVMGVGHALTENFIVDKGVPFTDRLARKSHRSL